MLAKLKTVVFVLQDAERVSALTPEQVGKLRRFENMKITLSRNTAVLVKCLGVVQANLANSPDSEVHEKLVDLLVVMPRTGMNRLQMGQLDKMIEEERHRVTAKESLA